MTTTATSSPRTITYSSRRNAPSPASVLSAAGVFARFASLLRRSRRWQNIPNATHTPSGHGASARLGFVRSGRFCAVRAARAPAAPMAEHPKAAHTPSGHGAPIARFGFVRSGRFCAVRAARAPAAPMTEHPKAAHAPSGHGAPIARFGRPLRPEFRRGRLSSLPTPPSPFHRKRRIS